MDHELSLACLAVQRAALVTKTLLEAVDKGILDKSDSSPVTMADFAAQALIIAALHRAFPTDGFVGEEDSQALRSDTTLLDRTWDLVSSTHLDDAGSESQLYTPRTKKEMLDLIDLGGQGQCSRQGRVWVLDPVDGTATFMNGQQYAVCLALVEDGRQKIGVLGCPNLRLESGRVHEDLVDRDGYGHQLFAVAGRGVSIRKMGRGALLPATRVERHSSVADPRGLQFVDCQAATSTNWTLHGQVAARLGAPWPNVTDVWAAQMRYVALAVGGCNAIVKIPRKADYQSKVWDHAGGMLLAEETGLVVSDLEGQPVDCGSGRTLGCYGMIVAPPLVHGRVVETMRQMQLTTRI
ncbi:Inositol monophosphatase family [Aspergillus sp. HF37]|nr:Inositol monophosphatase family [Aspergillus sp. HF37]